MKDWIMGCMAAMVAAGCGYGPGGRSASDDPCLHMRAEARTAARLEEDIRRLTAEIEADGGQADTDSAAKVEAESIRAYKREILAQTKVSMNGSALACEARKRPFDRYRTPPEREDNTF